MKHISYNREQTGKCYFEDTTIFLSDTEEEYNEAKKKYAAQAENKNYEAFTEFEDILSSTFKVESLLASLSQKEV